MKNIVYLRFKELFKVIKENYSLHQKGFKECRCEACQGIWLCNQNVKVTNARNIIKYYEFLQKVSDRDAKAYLNTKFTRIGDEE